MEDYGSRVSVRDAGPVIDYDFIIGDFGDPECCSAAMEFSCDGLTVFIPMERFSTTDLDYLEMMMIGDHSKLSGENRDTLSSFKGAIHHLCFMQMEWTLLTVSEFRKLDGLAAAMKLIAQHQASG